MSAIATSLPLHNLLYEGSIVECIDLTAARTCFTVISKFSLNDTAMILAIILAVI
jgi:hypothetical protein